MDWEKATANASLPSDEPPAWGAREPKLSLHVPGWVGLNRNHPVVAARFGLTPLDAEATGAAVRADWDEGKRRGVVGSPHFFTADGGSWFCPGLAISRDDIGNFIVAWKEGSAAFVDRVFQ